MLQSCGFAADDLTKIGDETDFRLCRWPIHHCERWPRLNLDGYAEFLEKFPGEGLSPGFPGLQLASGKFPFPGQWPPSRTLARQYATIGFAQDHPAHHLQRNLAAQDAVRFGLPTERPKRSRAAKAMPYAADASPPIAHSKVVVWTFGSSGLWR